VWIQISIGYFGQRSSFNIEKNFNKIKEEIQSYVLNAAFFKIPDDSMFEQFDVEFRVIMEIYGRINSPVNSLHVESNYYIMKAYQFLETNPTESLNLFLKALKRLLERNRIRPYSDVAISNMIKTYTSTLIKITDRSDKLKCNYLEDSFTGLVNSYLSNFNGNFSRLGGIICNLFLASYEEKILSMHSGNKSECKDIECFVDHLRKVKEVIEGAPLSKLSSAKIHNILYLARKKELHYFLTQIFYEQDMAKKNAIQNHINGITKDLVDYSIQSAKAARIYVSAMPIELQSSQSIKHMLAQKDIDLLSANYYKEAYSNKDILKAWKVMDQIRHLFVTKAFRENIEFSDNQLSYFGEEWTLLYVFAKVSLLKEEVGQRVSSLSQDWEKEIFTKIASSLENLKSFFRYEINDKKDYSLKIMTSTFAGNFSEYLVHDLVRKLFEYCSLESREMDDFSELFALIKKAKCKDDIKLSYILENGKPDIDIYIVNQCAIFLKNSPIDSDKIKHVWTELELCRKHNIHTFYYGFNFSKNVNTIEYIRKKFNEINSDLSWHAEPFDIKDLVSAIFIELERAGYQFNNFKDYDLLKILDY
jgi:hypothetical protein